jgi:hypothetical protein
MSLVTSYVAAVDFDGTLVENGWPKAGPDIPGGAEALREFLDAGIKVIIWTCRTFRNFPPGSDTGSTTDVVRWLADHGFASEFGKNILLNENYLEVVVAFDHSESRKVYANCYIDDRNAGGFLGWDKIRQYVKADHARFLQEVVARARASAST